MKVYLAGPIFGCSDAETFDWRRKAKTKLASFCEVIDPSDRDYRGRENENAAEIVASDKRDIGQCDVLLAHLGRPSAGTSMEILYAHMLGKLVLSVVPMGPVSPWIKAHSSRVFRSIHEAFGVIREYEAKAA